MCAGFPGALAETKYAGTGDLHMVGARHFEQQLADLLDVNANDLVRVTKVAHCAAMFAQAEALDVERGRIRDLSRVLDRDGAGNHIEDVTRDVVGVKLRTHAHRLAEAEFADDAAGTALTGTLQLK